MSEALQCLFENYPVIPEPGGSHFLTFPQPSSDNTERLPVLLSGTLAIFSTVPYFILFPRRGQLSFMEQVYRIHWLETDSITENYFMYK